MVISRSMRNRCFKKLDDEFSSHAWGFAFSYPSRRVESAQVEGFSWLEADRFAQKGARATSLLKVPSPCVHLMLLEPDVACSALLPVLTLAVVGTLLVAALH